MLNCMKLKKKQNIRKSVTEEVNENTIIDALKEENLKFQKKLKN